MLCVYRGIPNSSQQQKAVAAGLSMKLSSVVKALGSLCLLLTDGFPVSDGEADDDGAPKIIGPHHVRVKAIAGEMLILHCEALNSEDMTLIYWLVNDSFPEETQSDGRIEESEESTLVDGTILQRSLVLKNVTSEDLKSTFICVVTSASGMAQKFITLAASSKTVVHKKRENTESCYCGQK